MMRIVIIGAGECGVRAAFALRDQGFDGTITLIGAEPHLPYERPPLSKDLQAAPKAIRPQASYAEANIDLRLGRAVEAIDPDRKQIHLADEILWYDKLLLATGSRARVLPGLDGCLTLRTADDAAAIMPRLSAGARIGIIGAGFIGLELAATARKAGAEVSVYQSGPHVLGRVVPKDIAAVVADRHRTEGVALHTDASVASADAVSITIENGQRNRFDVVIAGVGAVPNVELAQAAGLRIDNGIWVDAAFRSSVVDIFAAGDCCNFPRNGARLRLESWKAAQDQGAHVAASMLGSDAVYARIPWFWSDQYDLTLQVAGLFEAQRPTHARDSGPDARIVFQCNDIGCLSAVAGVGPGNSIAKDLRLLEKLIEKRAAVAPAALADASVNLKSLLKAS